MMELTESEPTQGNPAPRKRRRWLIVAFVLVLGLMGTWWYWPRGDARFVGKWNVKVRAKAFEPKTFDYVLLLKSDRTSQFEWGGLDSKQLPRGVWAVSGQSYRNGSPTGFKSANDAIELVQRWLPVSWRHFQTDSEELHIQSISDQIIELSAPSGERITMTRLPG